MAIPFHLNNEEEDSEESSHCVGNSEEKQRGEVVATVASMESYSFLTQLVKELVLVCCKYWKRSSRSGPPNGRINRERGRRQIQSSPRNRTHLPDLIHCHTDDNIPPVLPLPQTDYNQDHVNNSRLSPSTGNQQLTQGSEIASNSEPKISSDYSPLDFKLSLNFTHQKIGRCLRTIADKFKPRNHKQNNNCPRRYKRLSYKIVSRRTIKLEIDFKMVIPMVLIGLGLRILRRNG